MTKGKKWLYMVAGGVAALTLVFGAAFVFINAGAASAGKTVQPFIGTEYTRMSSKTSC